MEQLTQKIVNYCINNDTYNFKDQVNSIDEFKSNTRDLILFNPIDIIDYLNIDKLELCKDELNQVNNIIDEINNISYEILINSFIDSIVFYNLKDINIVLNELLNKKLYKRFISLTLAYIILKNLHTVKDINIKDGNFLKGFIVTQFNNIIIADKSILSIMDQLNNDNIFSCNYIELTSVTNKIRNDINNLKGVN